MMNLNSEGWLSQGIVWRVWVIAAMLFGVLSLPSAWAADFNNNGDGTVTDWDTGLTWQREDDNTVRNWQAALNYCVGLTLAGGGWRLPAAKELASIVDYTQFDPVINTAMFPNTNASYYWSASSNASTSSFAWLVTFGYGYVNATNKTYSSYVRCVR